MISEDPNDRVDPRLEAAYAELKREPLPAVEWESLRRSIRVRAAPVLRGRRANRFAQVPRTLVPLALAASVAFALWIGPRLLLDSPAAAPSVDLAIEVDDDDALLEALVADLTEQEFRSLVTGNANPEALLAVAVSSR